MTTQDETEHLPAVVEPGGAPAVANEAERTPAVAEEAAQPAVGEARDRRKRRTRRTAFIVVIATAVAAAAGVAATGAFSGDDAAASPTAPDRPVATTKVQRITLTSTETVDGTLGHGEPTAVTDASASGQSGQGGGSQAGADGEFITWVPGEGDTLERGDTVYRVNERKVPLLYGSIPFYRTLEPGIEGADVRMLERNLADLGYDGFDVDDEYTSGTAQAVEEWQDDLGAEETGTVRPGDAVVAPGARRVAELKTSPGAVVGGEVLTWTGTERIVSMDLDPQHEDLVKEGSKATVRLPDGSTVVGEVTDIGTAGNDTAGSGAGAGGEGQGADEATLPVQLKIKDQKKLGRYQAASVDVILEADSRRDVLAVPVNALMARPGGGYALEVPTAGDGGDSGSELVPVELGMFANGLVEVKGSGIKEGMNVGVPK
ncbi:peptidoglycan-binding domain-containing protein [Streptomyces cyaneochromogenes]|uniref:peptidoglycan-binding domain-containing protein n=1 Tax=Streptomyces cyaneochromogenes TaxID=2496836 RepID=UPI001E468145|nr:peptidoglycan-binding domain-containing protein [Streptomyces cyaneochromogenes]